MRIPFTYRRFAVAVCGAATLAASAVSTAAAQPLPFQSVTPDPSDPVQQLMLSGEASAVSQYLGISTDELRTELAGRSLADVAQMHGQPVDGVTRVVVEAANDQLDTAVAQGDVSKATSDQYRMELSFFAPMLVRSAEASAMALQYASS